MIVKNAVRGAGGWLLTAGCVAAIVLLVGGDHSFSGAATVTVAVVAGIALLVPAVVASAYMLVRRRNRAAEITGGLTSPKARALQTSLASMLDRVNTSTDDAFGLSRVVLADRLELTATNVAELDDRWDALSFIWFARPSQPADYLQSPQFDGLPLWAQDAVVLLDLRRELQLRGLTPALSDTPGFYSHTHARIAQAARRTGSTDLMDALNDRHRAAFDPGRSQEREAVAGRMLELLDEPHLWAKLLGTSP